MRAYGYRQFGDASVQEFLDLPEPTPEGHEVVVEVRAAGVNPVDWKIRSGLYGDAGGPPYVLGREGAGVVRAVGPEVDGFAVGDEVFGRPAQGSGTFAERAVLDVRAVAHKPAKLGFLEASTLTVAGATAYDGLVHLGLAAGQTLLLNGASGGVGVFALQIARDLGIAVFGVAGPANQELIESLGAVFVPKGDGVAERVRALLPDGVDAVLDVVGGDPMRAVAPLVEDKAKLISAADPGVAELGGSLLRHGEPVGVLDAVAALVADGKVDPKVEDVYGFDEAGEAVRAVEAGPSRGKIVLNVSDDRELSLPHPHHRGGSAGGHTSRT